ncbi:MAG TPA: hypothetical protein VGQ89_08365 [Candidatus Limnocylindrales bacterium]|jgi:hypothetical protein|nr:hypothetical protein [Candidatus Limnocylindrales bacterium]
MASIAGHRPPIHEALRRVAAPAPVAPAAMLLLAMALGGLGLTVLGGPPSAPEATGPATVAETEAAEVPIGDIPIIGDPIRDLTLWWSNRLSDANKAGLDSLRGNFLTPIDPLADDTVRTLYGKILLVTIPLLTLGGIVLGYLIMVSRTTGESAYTARAVTPRFVVGATLSVLGIFLASVFAQFVIATDGAIVGVAIGSNALGGADAWPASGGVFQVLQNGGFDPRVPEGPGNWNSGAWLSAGLVAAILVTFLQMVNGALSALERLLVLVGPLCLAAYAIPATQRITNAWLKVLMAILLVRFAWTMVFVLFSLESLGHLDAAGTPPTIGDMNALLGLATGGALLMLLLPFALIPLALSGPGPLRTET